MYVYKFYEKLPSYTVLLGPIHLLYTVLYGLIRPYTIFIWHTFISSPLHRVWLIASWDNTPLLSHRRVPGGAPCWSSRKLICHLATELGLYNIMHLQCSLSLRHHETALDCLRICNKVTKGCSIWSTTTWTLYAIEPTGTAFACYIIAVSVWVSA